MKPHQLINESKWQFSYRKDVIKYYIVELNRRLTSEERKVIKYLKINIIHYFPYPFISKYNSENFSILFDQVKNLRYVNHHGKRLYFKRAWDELKIRKAYNFLLIEQDPESPHRYLTDNFFVQAGDTVIDVGTAEGNFALECIDKVKKVYLIEADSEWMEALNATFEPWKEKVVILNKFVSDYNSENTISLDTIIHEKIEFIKADVEGEEMKLLAGSTGLLKKYFPKIIVCAYHKGEHATQIEYFLNKLDYHTDSSKGFMIFLDNPQPPYLRRGLIRAVKNATSLDYCSEL